MRPRPIWLTLLLVLGTMLAGLVVRFAPLGLPAVVSKYGGSLLWAAMVYWLVSAIMASARLPVRVLTAGIIATAVELLKLYHRPELDAFRLTLPGILLLGRFFSVADIVAYWLAIVATAWLDRGLRAVVDGRRAGVD